MDRAYEDNKTRALAKEHRFNVVVPPKKNRKAPWEYDKELSQKRNQLAMDDSIQERIHKYEKS